MSIPVIRIYFRLGKGKSCVTATWFSLQSYLALCCGSYIHFFPLSLSPYPFMPCFAMVYMGDGGYQVPINFLFFLSSLFSTFLLSSFTVSLFFPLFSLPLSPLPPPHRSRELRTQKLKSDLLRTRSLKVLPLKPGVGQYIAIHVTLTARNFFLAYFCPSGPFACIFSETSLPSFSRVSCG